MVPLLGLSDLTSTWSLSNLLSSKWILINKLIKSKTLFIIMCNLHNYQNDFFKKTLFIITFIIINGITTSDVIH